MYIPEGWKLVPIEPTGKMLDVFDEQVSLNYNPANSEFQYKGRHTYAAMLNVAPTPPACKMCNGHGLIGGFVSGEQGYYSESCPNCNTPK